jgi:hypothetical protein
VNPQPSANDNAPFGTQPRRSLTPLLLWAAVYLGWLGVLYWLIHTVRK